VRWSINRNRVRNRPVGDYSGEVGVYLLKRRFTWTKSGQNPLWAFQLK
jgi:hypothetical protein